MKNNLSVAIFSSLLLVGGARSQQIISYFTSTSSPITVSPSGASRTLELPGFDASLGTLQQVQLTLSGTVSQLAKGENLGPSSSPFSYNITATATLDQNGGPNIFTSSLINLAGSGSVSAFDGTLDFKGSSAFHSYADENNSQTTDTPLNSVYLVPAASLASYITSSSIDFIAKGTGNSTLGGGGNMVAQTTDLASFGLKIEYTYSPIPEPATYAGLMGLATFLAVAMRQRQSRPDPSVAGLIG